MVAPLVLGGIAVASALVQYMNSKEGQALSAEQREELKRQIDAVKKPDFDYSKFDPKYLSVVGTYNPEVADFVVEQAPNLVKADSEGARKGRDAQMAALDRLSNLSKSGVDELTEMERVSAMNDVAKRSRGSVGAVSEDFARRGQAGGSKELLAQMFNAQQQNEQQAETGSRFAVEAQRRKLQSLMDSANLGGQIRNQDVELESANNNILNTFNQRFSNNKQNWMNNKANTLNDAQLKNLAAAQHVSDVNTGLQNDSTKYNVEYSNSLKDKDYQNEMDKVKLGAGVTDMARQDINSQTAANNNAVSGAAGGAMAGYSYYSKPNNQSNKPSEDDEEYNNNPLKRKY